MLTQRELISPEYRTLQLDLHRRPDGYGGKGRKWAETVMWLREKYDALSVLDYGCGEGSLAKRLEELGVECAEYDPAIPGKEEITGFADLVVCTDVLEHVEPNKLDKVLSHLGQLARKAIFLVVNLQPSNKMMADGRNAHLIVQSREWWQDRVQAAGLVIDDPRGLPVPERLLSPDKRAKYWVAVVKPC